MGFLSNTVVTELDNGVRLCCFHRRGASVELQVHIATGSMHEKEYLGCGLSHFLEHMVFQGCAGFPGRSVADEVNTLGGEVNAYTSYDRTCYRMQLPKSSWRKGLEMLSAMVRFPEFPEERFAAEKEVILRECERGNDDISRRVHEKFLRTMFLKHPVRVPVIGFKEMISGVTREMMADYYAKRYTPERCVVVAAGDLSAAEFFESAGEFFSSWKRSFLAEELIPAEPLPVVTRESSLIYPDPLERLFWGVRIPGAGSAQLPALELLFGVLGSGDGSVLTRELVLNKPLAVGLRSFCYSLGDIALAGVSAKAEPSKMNKLKSALAFELEKAADGKISASHLEREKGQQYADHLRELRDIVCIAGEIAGGMFWNNTPDAGDKFLENLRKTGIEDVTQAAAEFLDQQHWVHIHQHNRQERLKKSVPEKSRILDCWKNKSGNTVIHAPDNQLPLCSFFMVLPGGAIFEPAGKSGITRLLAQVLPSGGGKYDENAFLRELDSAGAVLDVSAGANSVTFELSAPARKISRAMKLMCAMLAEPRFEQRVVEREKMRLHEAMISRQYNPVKAGSDRAMQLLYGDHPYAFARSGKTEDMAGITRDEVAGFFENCKSGKKIYGFGGDITAAEAEKFSLMLDAAMKSDAEGFTFPAMPEFSSTVRRDTVELEREQTVVLRMLPGLSSAASDDDSLEMAEILHQAENGLASTLFKTVREEHALSYSVGMSFSAGFHPGTLSFYAMTAAGAGKQVMTLLNDEIRRLGEEGLSETEFDAAKQCVIFDAEKNLDSPESLLRTAVLDAYYGRPPLDILDRPRRVAGISLSVFNERIKKYFTAPAGVEVTVIPQEKES